MDLMNYGQPMQPLNRRNHSSGTTAQSLSQSVTQPLNKPTYPLCHPNQGKRISCCVTLNQGKHTSHCVTQARAPKALETPKYFVVTPHSVVTPASDSPSQGLTATNTKDVVRRRDIFQDWVTNTEKSSVPYKTPSKNHRERTILGVFGKKVYVR